MGTRERSLQESRGPFELRQTRRWWCHSHVRAQGCKGAWCADTLHHRVVEFTGAVGGTDKRIGKSSSTLRGRCRDGFHEFLAAHVFTVFVYCASHQSCSFGCQHSRFRTASISFSVRLFCLMYAQLCTALNTKCLLLCPVVRKHADA